MYLFDAREVEKCKLMIVIVVVVPTTIVATGDTAAVRMAGRRRLFQTRKQGLRSARDADEREQRAIDAYRSRSHFENDVVNAQ